MRFATHKTDLILKWPKYCVKSRSQQQNRMHHNVCWFCTHSNLITSATDRFDTHATTYYWESLLMPDLCVPFAATHAEPCRRWLIIHLHMRKEARTSRTCSGLVTRTYSLNITKNLVMPLFGSEYAVCANAYERTRACSRVLCVWVCMRQYDSSEYTAFESHLQWEN